MMSYAGLGQHCHEITLLQGRVCFYCKTNKFVFADFATFIYLFIHFLSCSCNA